MPQYHKYVNNHFTDEFQCSFAGSYPLTTVLAFTYYKTAPACHVQAGAVFCLFGLNVSSFGCQFYIFGIHKMKGRETPPIPSHYERRRKE